MEILFHILIVLILLRTSIKLSFNKWWHSSIVLLVLCLIVILFYPFAIQMSKTQVASYLNDTAFMQNIAVVVTIESALMVSFSFMALREMFGKVVTPWFMNLLRWFPGFLIVPVLFYLLTYAIFNFAGSDFQMIAIGVAFLVFVVLMLVVLLFKFLVPDLEIRYEMHFVVTIFVAIVGLLTTVTNEVSYAAVKQSFQLEELMLAAAIFFILFGGGMLWNILRWKIKK